MSPARGSEREGRWRGYPNAARLVRVLALVVPVAAGLGTAISVGSVLPRSTGGAGAVTWWLLVLGSSLGAVWVTERLTRRLMPLAALLKLTLAFPDRAPSRYRVARAAGNTRLLERRVREARERGVSDDPTHAAEMVLTLVAAIEAHDRRTRGHSERVRAFVDMLAEELGLSPEARVRLRWAALLHDLGKLRVEAEILNKADELTDREWDAIRAHPEAGARLAAPLLPWLGVWGRAIPEHHERFDGAGYPHGRAGEGISLAGRITAIADAFETMTAARSYKKPMSPMAARRELVRCAESQFDPALVRAFLNISLGRLMWTIGLIAWLAQLPLLRWVGGWSAGEAPLLAARSAALTKTLAGIVALGLSGTIAPPGAGAASDPSVEAPRTVMRMAEVPIEAGTLDDPRRGGRRAQEGRRDREQRERDDAALEPGRGSDGEPEPSGPAPSSDDGGGSLVSPLEPVRDAAEAVEEVVEPVVGEVEEVVDGVGQVVDDTTGSLPSLPEL